MTGRPYRSADGSFQSADLNPLALDDDATLFQLLLRHPDFLEPDVIFMADGRVLAESDPAWRTVLGWRRSGGPILLGVTTGPAPDALLIEVLQLAEASAEWPIGRWNEALAAYWGSADARLVEAIKLGWRFDARESWSVEAWTRAAWGVEPIAGRSAVGLLAAEMPPALLRAVDWLAAGGREIAAFEVRRMGAGKAPTYLSDRVAGSWGRPVERPPVAPEVGLRRETYVRHTGSVTAGLLSAVEARCLAAGSKEAWSGEDWVRFDGPGRSLRVFPGAAWVDLQFVGADEGTLAGLRYRYGVSTTLVPSTGAPPEVHLRLASTADFSPAVEVLLSAWLTEAAPPGERSVTPDRTRKRKRV
ncbi:MAG TPA: hypothetical protein VM737_09030 [Gemmatimonadota bacterium]|nr:hypothetical protein [Gemmatimonadota bacterium]